MKIRIEGDSVRLRLRKSEVSELAEQGEVRGSTEFPQGLFNYCLRLSHKVDVMEGRLDPAGIVVLLPAVQGEKWVQTDQVGFEYDQPLNEGKSLHLLVEKDFVCLDRDPVGQEDQYPNPKLGD